jgi:hypothetical protein
MDNLFAELVSAIAGHLEEHTLYSLDSFLYLTETPPFQEKGSPGWLIYTSGSRQDICSFRLVCRKFHANSSKSFGRLLDE